MTTAKQGNASDFMFVIKHLIINFAMNEKHHLKKKPLEGFETLFNATTSPYFSVQKVHSLAGYLQAELLSLPNSDDNCGDNVT